MRLEPHTTVGITTWHCRARQGMTVGHAIGRGDEGHRMGEPTRVANSQLCLRPQQQEGL